MIEARAEIVREAEAVAAMMRLVRASEPMAGSIDAAMSAQIRASAAKRVALRFAAARTVSWDHAKLGSVY